MANSPSNIPQYINYIRMLLKKSNYNKYIDQVCSSIENNNYKMSPRQFIVLERYRKGDSTPYSPKN